MKFERQTAIPRPDWKAKVTEVGMYYHTVNNQVYWNENNVYVLDPELVDKIEAATAELHQMCANVVADIIDRGDYRGYNLTDDEKYLIETSWRNGHQHLYGRFDLGITADHRLFMFEYNADTPTSLLEASVVQWNWKEEIAPPDYDQFNSIHEKLIERWKEIIPPDSMIHFTTMTHGPYEDWANLHYLMETASLAGFNTSSINLEMIGWDHSNDSYVDMINKPILNLFKLYPWEWMTKDQFAEQISMSNIKFYEPPWKMLISNKMILARLWEYYPNHDLLLEAYDPALGMMRDVLNKPRMIKPKLGREGQGIVETNNAFPISNHSDFIVQEKLNVIKFGNIQPVIGSWVIGDQPAGIGIREDVGITTNNSQFVPHVFK